jgi:YegS/Rv2252/BmrU family lipid kinase
MRRAVLIYNPVAGNHSAGRLVSRVERELSGAGFSVDAQATSDAGDAERLARSAAAEEVSALFVCGGDGSLRECAGGLLGSTIPLGFIPCGTANVMARALQLPDNAIAAAAALRRSKVEAFDVGLCNGLPFLMQASVGLDAEVLRRAKPSRKRFLGRGEVALAALSGWHSYQYPDFEVRWPGGHQSVTFAALCNIPFYGGGWRMAPEARWDDALLDMVLFSGSSRTATLGFARDLVFTRQIQRPDVRYSQVEEATISSAPGLNLQLDGDFVPEQLPARLELARQQVNLLVPS